MHDYKFFPLASVKRTCNAAREEHKMFQNNKNEQIHLIGTIIKKEENVEPGCTEIPTKVMVAKIQAQKDSSMYKEIGYRRICKLIKIIASAGIHMYNWRQHTEKANAVNTSCSR